MKCFSALQRAEIAEIGRRAMRVIDTYGRVSVLFNEPKLLKYCANISEQKRIARFQCSSASRKFLNYEHDKGLATRVLKFQCSSASRKFLNANDSRITRCRSVDVSVLFSEPKIPQSYATQAPDSVRSSFSALQRAENSSIPTLAPASIHISDRDDHASSFLSLPGASP